MPMLGKIQESPPNLLNVLFMNSLDNYLSEAQISVLRAAVNRIIPADDFPCGWDAGAENFFSQLMTKEPQFLFAYQQGLTFPEAEAFISAGPEEQDTLLAGFESSFFTLLVSQTMESFYADPGNGGNKDQIAWKMIGFEVTA